MKLSEQTIELLNNFSEINESVVLLQGKKQTTMSTSKSILAVAEIEEEIPKEFGIHLLGKFNSLVSLFKDSEIEFGDKSLTLKEGANKAEFFYSDTRNIIAPPKDKEITLPNVDITFELSKENLKSLFSAAKVLGVTDFVIEGDGTNINITVVDVTNKTSDKMTKNLGETTEEFKFILDIECMKLMAHDYDVAISKNKNGLVRFTSKQMKLTYYLPVQKKE